MVLDDFVAGDFRECRLTAEGRVAKRVIAEDESVRIARHQALQAGVFRRGDKCNRAVALLHDFFFGQAWPHKHVRDQLDHEVDIAGQEFRGDFDGLDVGARRDVAADTGGGLGEFGCVAIAGAFLHD